MSTMREHPGEKSLLKTKSSPEILAIKNGLIDSYKMETCQHHSHLGREKSDVTTKIVEKYFLLTLRKKIKPFYVIFFFTKQSEFFLNVNSVAIEHTINNF